MAEEMNNANATVNNDQQPTNEAANNVNTAPANEQPNNATTEELKKKRRIPGWLKIVGAGLAGTAIGAGVVALIKHFTGADVSDAVQTVSQTVQPAITQAPQQAIGTVVNTTAEAVKTASGQQ